jgi:hypothetical protein
MSFGDDVSEPAKPHRPTLVVWRCRRCGCDENLPATNPLVTVREAVERGHVLRMHDCADGAQGVADLVGSGPGRPLGEVLAERRAEADKA